MKKLFLLPLLILVAFSFHSCEDDDLNPLPEKVPGQYMILNIKNNRLEYTDIANTAFTGTLSNPSGDVVKYDLYVRRYTKENFLTGDYVLLDTYTSFPMELSITPQKIASTLGLSVSDLEVGEKYAFYAYSYNASGNRVSYSNLARIIQVTNPMNQGYRFVTDLAIVTPTSEAFDNHQDL